MLSAKKSVGILLTKGDCFHILWYFLLTCMKSTQSTRMQSLLLCYPLNLLTGRFHDLIDLCSRKLFFLAGIFAFNPFSI